PPDYGERMTLDLLSLLPGGWRERIEPHLDPATTASLNEFVAAEYANGVCYPPLEDLFTAFRLCPPEEARVLILGQDPYHKAGQAHGLSFSVRPGVPVPPSLRNVYKELRADLGVEPPPNGDLTGWAAQGVLLLNAVLTVREATPGSHANKGWEHLPTLRSRRSTSWRTGSSSCSGAATPARRRRSSPTRSTWSWRPGTRAR